MLALVLATMLLVSAMTSACVAHPVGPARSLDAYQGKAVKTAEAARSAAATVRLLSKTASEGRTFSPYTAVSVSEQEDALVAVQGTFGSIQPPDVEADRLRTELNTILTSTLDHVAQVRIAARRGELSGLQQVAEPLTVDITALDTFIGAQG